VVLGYDFFGRPQYAELDEGTLKAIAKETGGEYYKSVDSKTLERIYSLISEKIEREKEETSIKDWFMIAAAILLVGELYARYGKIRVLSR
jgi:Ca-activated chloride channel family protein